MLLQVSVPLSSRSRFHFVVPVKVLQRGLGDVDAPACVTQTVRKDVVYPQEPFQVRSMWRSTDSPSLPSSLHLICERYVIRPDVKLPLAQAENTTVDTSAVDAHTHVHVDARHLSHQPSVREHKCKSFQLQNT